jgi:hypothetical protein
MQGLGTAPDSNAISDLVNAGYNSATINQLIAMGATNEQLQALPFPADPATMQAAVNALAAALGATAGTMTSPASSSSGANTSSTIATIEQGTANIIRASQGQPASPFDFSSSGPWSSFQTQYSPYGVPAGYPSAVQPGVSLTSTSNIGLWLMLGIGAVLLMGGGRR